MTHDELKQFTALQKDVRELSQKFNGLDCERRRHVTQMDMQCDSIDALEASGNSHYQMICNWAGRINQLDDAHNALCDVLADINDGGLVSSERIGRLIHKSRLHSQGDTVNSIDDVVAKKMKERYSTQEAQVLAKVRNNILSEDEIDALLQATGAKEAQEDRTFTLNDDGYFIFDDSKEAHDEGSVVVDGSTCDSGCDNSSNSDADISVDTVDAVMAQMREDITEKYIVRDNTFRASVPYLLKTVMRPIITELVRERDDARKLYDAKLLDYQTKDFLRKRAERAEKEAFTLSQKLLNADQRADQMKAERDEAIDRALRAATAYTQMCDKALKLKAERDAMREGIEVLRDYDHDLNCWEDDRKQALATLDAKEASDGTD